MTISQYVAAVVYLSGVSPLLGVVSLHARPRPHAQLAPGAGRVDAGQPGVVTDVQGPI